MAWGTLPCCARVNPRLLWATALRGFTCKAWVNKVVVDARSGAVDYCATREVQRLLPPLRGVLAGVDPLLSTPAYAQGDAKHSKIGVSIRHSGIGLKQKRHQTKNGQDTESEDCSSNTDGFPYTAADATRLPNTL